MEHLHYIVIGTIIVLIVVYQFKIYNKTRKQLKIFKNIFPERYYNDDFYQTETDEPVLDIESRYTNPVMSIIVVSINQYLQNNKGAVSDFHLIKDIVERNCNVKEEEIDTQIPVPLYLGLVGTMAGILIGIGFLSFSGGLDALLGNGDGNGTEGVKTLLGGVAMAMISSICGMLLTIVGAGQAKSCKVKMENNKNTFLSWIQANILPKFSSDNSTVIIIERFASNLLNFNKEFAKNTHNFQSAINSVTGISGDLAKVLTAINNLRINNIAEYNIKVYDKLMNCTEEIGRFGNYLTSVNEYIANVKALNDRLDQNETRTKAIEDMGTFFKQEKTMLEERKGDINKAVGSVDATLQQAFTELKENMEKQLKELTIATSRQHEVLNINSEAINTVVASIDGALQQAFAKLQENTKKQFEDFSAAAGKQQETINTVVASIADALNNAFAKMQANTEKQFEDFSAAAGKQQEALQKKLEETGIITEELKNLTGVKQIMENLATAANKQNEQLDRLAESIEKLAKKIQRRKKQEDSELPSPIIPINKIAHIASQLLFWRKR